MIWRDALFAAGAAAVVLLTAHYALRAAVLIARRFGWSDAFIGMTIVSVGTSLPEIITHVAGSVRILQHPGRLEEISALTIGANVGSDVFQQNFLLSVVAILGVIAVDKQRLRSDIGGLLGGAALLWAFCWDGTVARWEGAVLAGAYVAYLYFLGADKTVEEPGVGDRPHPLWRSVVELAAAFAVMAWAAEELVGRSVALAEALEISASFFGVILLGVATAFPELTTSLLAIYRGNNRISAGVLIGSNVTNPTLALGLGAAISTYAVPAVVYEYDLPVKVATTFLLWRFLYDRAMKNWEAAVLIATYLVYLYLRLEWYPVDF